MANPGEGEMMRRRIKNGIVNLAILAGALLFSGLICEAILKVFDGAPAQQPGHHQLFMEYDALLGWRKVPNLTGQHVTSEYSISERMNSKGIRGPEYAYAKRRDEFRILVLGDSFAEGYTVEFHELFSEIFKQRLNAHAKGRYYEVMNMGAGGYSTDQELLLFQYEGKKYNPDLTLVLFYDNDVWFNNQPKYWRGYKPLFQLDDEGNLTLINGPVPKPDPPPKPDTPKALFWKNPLEATAMWLSKQSYVYRFIHDRILGTAFLHAPRIKVGLEQAQTVGRDDDEIMPIPNEFRVYQKHQHTDVAHAWKMTEVLLRQLREEVHAVGGALLIFYVPVRASVYLDEWKKMKRQYDIADDHWSIEQIRDDLMALCHRNHFDCVDPLEAFRAEAERLRAVGKRLYFVHDGHWNAEGHRFVGELLAQYLGRTSTAR
jgi:hypothetical protein